MVESLHMNPVYDFHVYDPGVPSQSTPDIYWEGKFMPHNGSFEFEFHWVLIDSEKEIKTFPFDAMYNYDLIHGNEKEMNFFFFFDDFL